MSANRSSNLLPIAGVMAAVSVFGGLLLVRGFQSFRPPATTPFLHESLGIESVNARLWQDPITAVEDHIKVAHNDPEAHGAEENTAIQKHLMVAKNDPEAHNATVETAIQEHIKAVHGDSEAHDADESKDVLKHVLMHVPVKEHEPPLHSIETLRKEIEETHHNNEGRLFILSVMVPGSHYAENREMRRRHRYAIISALGRKGLVPDNAEHIGYFLTNDTELSLSDHHSDGAKDHFSLAVPFEWFSFQDTKDAPDDPDDMTSNSQGDRALILWIDQQKIHDITTLASLLGKLLHFPKARRAISDPDRSIELSLIGPSNTAALLKLLIEEWKHNLPGAHGTHPGKVDSHQEKHAEFRKSIRENLYLYSSRTTASFENLKELKDFLLLEVDKWTVLYNRLVEYVFSRFGIKAPPPFNFEDGRLEFPRINPGLEMSRYNRARIVSYLTTGSMDQLFFPTHFIETSIPDEVLARDIAKELKLRRANLDDDQYIALIGEWDTYYGREFYRILADALKSESDLSDIEKLKLQNHILRFSYLRGMDGALSGQARTKQSDTSAAKRDQTSLNAFKVDADISIEQPFGPSQFDTMRRLASSIKEIAHGNKRIAAVGVIGSDLYDKQLVLQALRPSLPDAIFFTTDLDARLDHPSQYQWSRNLIIVSGHGLSLHKDLQQYIPPFRDAYQTSTFMATLLALGGVTYEHEEHGTVTLESDGHEMKIEAEGYSYEMNPHRYEVSRRGVIEFTPWKDNSANAVLYDSPGPWRFPISRIIWLYVLFTLAIILLSTMSKRLHRLVNMPTNSDEGPKRSVLMLILVALAVLAGFGGLIYYDHTSGSGEPFSLVAGVSIWPTEIIRVLTIIFCIRCLLLAEHENRRLDKKFEKKFGLVYVRGDGSLRKRVRKLLSVPNKSPNWIISIPHWFETVRSRLTVNFWGGTKLKDMEEIQAQHAWQEYQYRGRTECRLLRILIVMLLLAVLFGCLWIIVRPYVSPARGQFAFFTTWTIEYLSLTMIALLTLYVADRTRLCVQFVLSLAKTQTIWTDIAYKWKPVKNRKLEPEDAADYIDVLVIAKHTEVIGHMVLYPFIAIALLLVSRNSYFDNWGWPLFMIIFFTIMIGYAMTCAIVLRRAAEKSQTRAIRRLQNRLLGAFGDQDKARADQIENLIEEIRNIRQGAYSPWSQRPEIKALVPLGGVALIGILEILSLYGL